MSTGGTRREFLKSAAAGTAAIGLSSALYAAGSDTIKVGVIGCGGRGSGAADNVMHSAPNVQIVAIGDVFNYRVEGLRKGLEKLVQQDAVKKLGNSIDLPKERCFVGLDAYKQVIDSPANYIILATPPGFRPPHLKAAVAAGKHVFTEKPVAVDPVGCRSVFDTYEEALKKKLGVAAGTQRRHQLGYLETMKRVKDGAIGDITALRCHWNGTGIWFRSRDELVKRKEPSTDLAFQLNNWYHFLWVCGDHICEQHIHNLDVCNWAMGKPPVQCLGMGARLARPKGPAPEAGNIFDFFSIDYDYGDGVHMLSTCRQVPGTDTAMRGQSGISEAFIGTKGQCQANAYLINGERVLNKAQDKAAVNPYVQEHTDLIESIRKGTPINELKNVAESSLTAIMGRMSAYTGKAVTWDFVREKSTLDTMPASLSWDMQLDTPAVSQPGKTALV
ncbi:MAG: Gfo/Idh/MocA family protein [Gemmataceae bacterium]